VVFPKGSVLGPILFTINVSHTASIVSSHGVNQQQYADDTQLVVFLSSSSLSSSLCSLQRCVSSLNSRFSRNGLILNPTKTEAICFSNSPRLESLSNLTSIKVEVTSVSLVDYMSSYLVSLLTNISILISIFPTSALHPTSISVLSAIIALFLTQKLPVLLLVADLIISITFLLAFLVAITIVLNEFKTPWLESLY